VAQSVQQPHRRRGHAALARAADLAARAPFGAIGAAIVAARLADAGSAPAAAALALLSFSAVAFVMRRGQRAASHLPVLRAGYPSLVAGAATATCALLAPALRVAGLDTLDWLLVLSVSAATATYGEYWRAVGQRGRSLRIAFVGSAEAARRLGVDVARAHQSSYAVVGRIQVDDDDTGQVRVLGRLGELRATVLRERIDLLVLGSAVARLPVFDELAETCLDLRLQLSELSAFYEDVFGHVPTAEINAAWFAHLVDAHAHHPSPRVKRTVDIVASVVLGVVSLPLMAILAVLVRLDRGPAIYAQERIGEGGRPFRLYKLRTMSVGSGDEAAWAQEDDPRATPVGRLMRRAHLDELPQLWNVLRGEMSFVGPRPEQLAFVERLEEALPFYRRRHLIRPGLTGWAQVRCGYAGSEVGAAWKLCNDLYYVKHRSLGLDLLLFAETLGLLVFGTTDGSGGELVPWAGTGLAPERALAQRPPAPVPPAAPAGALPMVAMGALAGDDAPMGPES
jgi:exopolysaccharide biosynthesis polyprenyl glycosylphosphotransferase